MKEYLLVCGVDTAAASSRSCRWRVFTVSKASRTLSTRNYTAYRSQRPVCREGACREGALALRSLTASYLSGESCGQTVEMFHQCVAIDELQVSVV